MRNWGIFRISLFLLTFNSGSLSDCYVTHLDHENNIWLKRRNISLTWWKFYFSTLEGKLILKHLRQPLTEALIFHHFDLKPYIWMKTDAFGDLISGIFCQFILNSGPWHHLEFSSKKIISAETWYKTCKQEHLSIVKAFKTWDNYLKSYKFHVLVFNKYFWPQLFMNTTSFCSRQIRWA